MAEEHDIEAAMLANAVIKNFYGFRQGAANHANRRIDKQPNAEGRAVWTKARDLLRSPNPIPPYRGHFDSIPNPRAVRYERVQCFARGGAVNTGKVSKETAEYSPYGSAEEHCSICRMFEEPHGCSEVAGHIS